MWQDIIKEKDWKGFDPAWETEGFPTTKKTDFFKLIGTLTNAKSLLKDTQGNNIIGRINEVIEYLREQERLV